MNNYRDHWGPDVVYTETAGDNVTLVGFDTPPGYIPQDGSTVVGWHVLPEDRLNNLTMLISAIEAVEGVRE